MVPETIETLAVKIAALDRRLVDAMVSRDREERIRVEELAQWRHTHNDLLADAAKTRSLMQTKDEYEQRHQALENKLECGTE